MKNVIVTAFVFALVVAASSAHADGQTSFCKSGPVVAACPAGVESNTSVAIPNAQSSNQSVAYTVVNPQSVSPANTSQSVSPATNNAGNSVAYTGGVSNTSGSVAYSGYSSPTSGSVADGGFAGSSVSVVH